MMTALIETEMSRLLSILFLGDCISCYAARRIDDIRRMQEKSRGILISLMRSYVVEFRDKDRSNF